MRNLTLIILLAGCTSTPPKDLPPEPQNDVEVAQAMFVVGLRTETEGKLSRRFEDGSELTISHWAVVLSAVEVHLCEEASWQQLFIGTAYAHVSNSITRLGTPVAEDLMKGSGGAKIVGEIAPPLGTYCRAYAVFTPADDDVLNFTTFSNDDLLGHTAIIRGELAQPGMEPISINWAWDGNQVSAINLDSVSLRAPTDSFMLLVDKKVDAGLLDGLSVERVRNGQAADDLMAAFFSRVVLYRSGAP